MGRVFSTHRRDEKYVQNFVQKTQKEDLGIDDCVIIKWILEKQGVRLLTGFTWLRIKTNRAYSMHGIGEKCLHNFSRKTCRQETTKSR